MSNIMNDLHAVGLNPFAVTLLAESLLKSPLAQWTTTRPQGFFFPVKRGDCPGWIGVRFTLEAVPQAAEHEATPPQALDKGEPAVLALASEWSEAAGICWEVAASGETISHMKVRRDDLLQLIRAALATHDTAPVDQGEVVARSMETAPRDGTIIRLLVQFEDHPLEDDNTKPLWTIGGNSFENTGEDLWQFAGWSWSHDTFVDGVGTPVGWLPLIDPQAAPAAQPMIPMSMLRPIAVEAIRSITGCPDISNGDKHLTDEIESVALAAITAEAGDKGAV